MPTNGTGAPWMLFFFPLICTVLPRKSSTIYLCIWPSVFGTQTLKESCLYCTWTKHWVCLLYIWENRIRSNGGRCLTRVNMRYLGDFAKISCLRVALSRCELCKKPIGIGTWSDNLAVVMHPVPSQFEFGKFRAVLYGNKMRGYVYLILSPSSLALLLVKILLTLALEKSRFFTANWRRDILIYFTIGRLLVWWFTSKETHTTYSNLTWHKPFIIGSIFCIFAFCHILHTVQICTIYPWIMYGMNFADAR